MILLFKFQMHWNFPIDFSKNWVRNMKGQKATPTISLTETWQEAIPLTLELVNVKNHNLHTKYWRELSEHCLGFFWFAYSIENFGISIFPVKLCFILFRQFSGKNPYLGMEGGACTVAIPKTHILILNGGG